MKFPKISKVEKSLHSLGGKKNSIAKSYIRGQRDGESGYTSTLCMMMVITTELPSTSTPARLIREA